MSSAFPHATCDPAFTRSVSGENWNVLISTGAVGRCAPLARSASPRLTSEARTITVRFSVVSSRDVEYAGDTPVPRDRIGGAKTHPLRWCKCLRPRPLDRYGEG